MRKTMSAVAFVFSWLAAALPAGATTYVMMEDGALLDASPIVVQVRVAGASSALAAGMPVTDYQVVVEELLKGSLPGAAVVVRVPGAQRADGLSLHVWGAPAFAREEKALLFLVPRPDGTYGVNHLALGAFHLRGDGDETWAVRDLSGASVVSLQGVATTDRTRDYAKLRRWLLDREAGLARLPDYFAAVPRWRLEALAEGFTLFERNGLNFRWPDFDLGDTVTWFAAEGGQPGLAGGGFAEVQAALGIWSDDAGSNVDYRYGGTTTASGGLTDPCDFDPGPDGQCTLGDPQVNGIIFGDPNDNVLIFGSPFDCSSGGVIAAGGPWFSTTNTHTYRGKDHITIVSADVVTNANVGCFLSMGKAAEEVFTHELGHTLGFGHSCGDASSGPCDTAVKDDALMRAFAHGGDRGGVLEADDRAAAAALYTPADQIGCIPDGETLCLTGDRFQARVEFMAPGGAMMPAKAVSFSAIAGSFWFLNAVNPELTLKVLNNCHSSGFYWVFVGGLTNFSVDVTVTDTLTDQVWQASSPLEEPLGSILDTRAFATCP